MEKDEMRPVFSISSIRFIWRGPASLNTNWHDRWYEHVKPGEPKTIWMKFPAPPAEVKAITLNIPKTPPFEDITIQD